MGVTMSYGAAPTYVKLASFTATGSTASVTFSNIPQGYTDLVLETSGIGSGTENLECYINGDTGNNYSFTYMYGDGSVAGGRNTGTNRVVVGRLGTSRSNGTAHFQSYSNPSIFKTVITKKGKGNEITMLFSNIWRNLNPITSLQVFGAGAPAKTMSAGYTVTIYGIKAAFVPKATGGDIIVQDSTYWYHAFRTTGVFAPRQSLTADVLVIAGGGSGGGSLSSYGGGGGGGAGGLLAFTSQSLSATGYTVTVGAGGTGAAVETTQGTNGNDSQFGALTLVKGGGAGGNSGTVTYGSGLNGGSGGGAAALQVNGTNLSVGTATSAQGNNGALGVGNNGVSLIAGGGGGGAGAAGSAATGSSTSRRGGAGGTGVNTYSSWATATSTGASGYYAGGGGGSANGSPDASGAGTSTGGNGGGGAGAGGGNAAGGNGTATTGGGGGASSTATAGSGGSGLVIVRYSI